jgi:hypothetical protein
LFLRFYGHEFDPEERRKILAALLRATEGGKTQNPEP